MFVVTIVDTEFLLSPEGPARKRPGTYGNLFDSDSQDPWSVQCRTASVGYLGVRAWG